MTRRKSLPTADQLMFWGYLLVGCINDEWHCACGSSDDCIGQHPVTAGQVEAAIAGWEAVVLTCTADISCVESPVKWLS